jgi:ubiquinone/menaquinone biosynthesis C-methylase UbiE
MRTNETQSNFFLLFYFGDDMSINEDELDRWANVWREGMLNNIRERGGLDCTQYWKTREEAVQFDLASRVNGQEGIDRRMSQMNISKGDRILDIGAGTGALTLPMSRIAKEVTAIEPSKNMLWCLHNNLANEEVTNVRCIQKRWEEIDVEKDLRGSYDVVVASYSLGMIDIVSSLKKMNAVAKKTVFLFWFAEQDGANCDYARLWSLVKGEKYKGKPQSDVLFNILNDLCYNPKMEVTSKICRRSFNTLEKAVEEMASDMNVTNDDGKRKIGRYLSDRAVRIDGKYVFEEQHSNAILCWNPSMDQRNDH